MNSQPARPKPTSITRHYFRYLSANLLGVVAGLISFPIMTRLLSSKEYGIFGYFELYSLIWVAILKLGTQQSTVRLYSAYCLNRDVHSRKQFYTSLVLAPALISTLLFGSSLVLTGIAQWIWGIDNIKFLYIVLLLGQIDVLSSLITNIMLAREMSRTSMWLNVISRYVGLFLTITTIYFLMRSAMGVYLARILTGSLTLCYLIRWARRHCEFDRETFSPAILKESLSFGMPLVLSEISLIVLAFADRIVLKHLTGSFSMVGTYTIGYSLAMYVGVFMRSSVFPAFQPVANRLYETQGANAFRHLQRRMLRNLIYASLSACIGLAFVGQDLLILLAGRDKAAAGPVFQWIGANYICTPLFAIAAYGLTLTKRTRLISTIVILSALLNLGLNFLLIPHLGVMGAVYATVVSYLLMWSTQVICCPRDLSVRLQASDLLRPLVCGLLFIASAKGTHLFGLEHPVARLLAMGGIFIVTFVFPALTLDTELRKLIRQKISAVFPQNLRSWISGIAGVLF